jgi:hypothetical protein
LDRDPVHLDRLAQSLDLDGMDAVGEFDPGGQVITRVSRSQNPVINT